VRNVAGLLSLEDIVKHGTSEPVLVIIDP